MGRYSRSLTYKEIISKGFMKAKDIPKKYSTSDADWWFAYYGVPYKNEVAELHVRTARNIGSPVTLAKFSVRSMGINKKLFIKAMQMEGN